jgi:hypothetical protein
MANGQYLSRNVFGCVRNCYVPTSKRNYEDEKYAKKETAERMEKESV